MCACSLDDKQTVAIAVFATLAFSFNVFFAPFLGSRTAKYTIIGVYTPLVSVLFLSISFKSMGFGVSTCSVRFIKWAAVHYSGFRGWVFIIMIQMSFKSFIHCFCS